MKIDLMRKLLFSVAALTSFYLGFIFALHEDLTKPIKSAAQRIVPGILMFIVGVVVHNFLLNPDLIMEIIPFKHGFLDIRSGFIRRAVVNTMLPFIAASVLEISITAAQIAIIDKLLYAWRRKRLPYLLALAAISFLVALSGMTLFALIMGDAKTIEETTRTITELNSSVILTLNTILLVLLFINIFNVLDPKHKIK